MRVIAGLAKGRRLQVPKGSKTRPFTDRAKEALFSALGDRVEGAAVLDLYAGSGSLGIEALSRGAGTVVFVEKSRSALTAIEANLETCRFEGVVVAGDVGDFLERDEGRYDLVFIDPPYRLSLALVSEVLAAAAGRLADGGTMIVHRRAGEEPPAPPNATRLVDERRYGDTQLYLYRRPSP